MAWVLDLDGVIWLAHHPIDGAADAVARLRAAGERVLFVTNFSALTVAEAEGKLAAVGIDATGDVVTSSMAAATLVEPGERVLVAGGPGVVEAVERRGAEVVGPDVPSDEIDAVVVGFHREFDFARVTRAARALHAGARLVATNDDPTYPTPEGLEPGNGALLACIATAGKVTPTVAGKPYAPVAALVHDILGDPPEGGRHTMVGDLPATDGMLGRRLGYRFALVLSGVTSAEQVPTVDPRPDVVAESLAALVAAEFG